MKKFLSLFLSILLVLNFVVCAFAAQDNTLNIIVVNDLHLDLKDSTALQVAKRNSLDEEYAHVSSGGQLPYESAAIIKAFLRDAAALESKTIIMPGDLTTIGTVEEHTAFVALIKEFEVTTGKSVYVVPGNHDLFDTSVSEFEALYADFGYNEAIANDPNTASYVVNLDNGYRLLAIDSCLPGRSPHGVDADLVNWVKEQCAKAAADGKKVIAMMHHNLIEHFVLVDIFHPTAVVTDGTNTLADTLADGGVKYIFTAHTHDHDIAKHTSPSGNVLYDCVTTALNAYPCAYRDVVFGDEVKISTKYVRSIDTSLLPAGIHENAMALAESNFLKYAKNSTYLGIYMTISAYTKPSVLKKYIKTDDEELQAIINPAIDKVCEAVALPIYAKDEVEEGKSLESLGAKIGVTLPESEYKNLIDVAVKIYQAHAEGDENYPAYTDEMIILQRAVAIVLNYALADLEAADYSRVLSFVLNLFDITLSQDILDTVGGLLEKFKGNEVLLTSALMPILTKFSVDTAPADNNVTLPGYESKAAESEDLLTMIKNFFKKIFDFFHSIFAMLA